MPLVSDGGQRPWHEADRPAAPWHEADPPAPQWPEADPPAPQWPEADRPAAPWHRPAADEGDLYADLSAHDPAVPPPGTVAVPARPAPRRRTAMLLAVGAVALLAGGAGGAAGAYLVERQRDGGLLDPGVALPSPAPASTARAADSVAGIVGAVVPSVVTLEVNGGGERGTGSGFVLDRAGYVLTNNHVVAPAAARGGRVRIVFSDGRRADATIVGRDVSYDLAVVKTDVRGLRPLALGNSDSVAVGDPVIAVGAPLGLKGTVTTGILSARNRPVVAGEAQQTSFINALQTDAAINPGNSGGPLLDAQGRVVGVNAAIARIPGAAGLDTSGGNIGLGFAIPSNQARRTAEQLIRTGKSQHPIIGALLDESDSTSDEGVRVARTSSGGRPPLTPGGPAATAGIKPGDLILAIDGQPVNSLPELVVAIRSHNPGDTVRLTVRTGGDDRTVPVRLAASDS